MLRLYVYIIFSTVKRLCQEKNVFNIKIFVSAVKTDTFGKDAGKIPQVSWLFLVYNLFVYRD